MGVCNCSIFCCMLLYVHSSIAIILMGKRELIALLNLSSWCLVMAERLFLAVPRGCLQFVIVVFPDHTHLLFLMQKFMKLIFINCHSYYLQRCMLPDERCLSHGMCLLSDMMTLYFLNDIAIDAELTQKNQSLRHIR